MTYKARFTHGSRHFDIDANEFSLFQDFVFPAADESLNISSPNVGSTSGGQVISKTPQDRWWAWSVRILGTTIAQTHMAARRLSMWLSQAVDDKSDKVYFEYTPAYNVPAPIWGQHGAPYRFEVKAAIVDLDGSYYVADIPSKALIVPISLLVGPHALGARQLLAQAKGAVIEDTIGTIDGLPRGTIVASSLLNKITNPVFGHATYDTGWTTGADLVASKNTDPDFILWGSASVKLMRVSAGANYKFYQSIDADSTASHTLMAYAKKQDGSAIAAADIRLYYNGNLLTTTYTARGNGWYQLSAQETALDSGVSCGVAVVATNTPFYVAGVQFKATTEVTPFTYGDMLGCAWTGTAHESTSSAVDAYIRIPTSGLISASGGSIRVAIKHMDDSAKPNSGILFSDGVAYAYYNAGVDKYTFTDGTNSVTSATAKTFDAGTIHILHFVWGVNGLQIYLNGAIDATGATFTAWTVGAYLYIGVSHLTTVHFNGTFLCPPEIFDAPLTTTQVLADYNDVSAHVRGGDGFGQRLSSLPYLWTKDGDNVVDNYTLSTTHNHFAIVNGLQGSAAAETEISGTLSADNLELNMSLLVTRNYFDPADLFADCSGTGTADTVGTEATVTSLAQTSVEIGTGLAWNSVTGKDLYDKSFTVIARVKDAVNGYLRAETRLYAGGYTVAYGNLSRPYYTETTVWRLFKTPFVSSMVDRHPGRDFSFAYTVKLFGYRTATTNNITVDYIALFPRPFAYVYFGTSIETFTLIGRDIRIVSGGVFPGYAGIQRVTGDAIEFVPNKYNALITLMGGVYDEPTMTETLTYSSVYYTPRYMLI